MSNTRLVTFGAGASRYRRAARRVANEARQAGLFRSVEAITEKKLRDDHGDFVRQNAAMLRPEVRGFGYWLWKPHLIDAALQSSSVDFLVYVDSGVVLNLSGAVARRRFDEYHQIADANGLLVMQNNYEEQAWCKADTLERVGLQGSGCSTGQAEAGFLLIRNSGSARDLVRAWLDLCREDDYRYLDDSPSERPNAAVFNEHRHDQAILSCLCKVAGVAMIPDELNFPSTWSTAGADAPFWSARHRWGSAFDPTDGKSMTRRVEGLIDRTENWRAERRAWSAKFSAEGGVTPQGKNRGLFGDHWAAPHVIHYAHARGTTFVMRGRLPGESRQLIGQQLRVWCNGELLGRRDLEAGAFSWEFELPEHLRGREVQIKIHASRSFIPKRIGLNDDARRLSYYLDEIAVVGGPLTDTGGTR